MTSDVLEDYQWTARNLSHETNNEMGRRVTTKPVLTSTTITNGNTNRRSKFSTGNQVSSTRSSTTALNQRQSPSADFFSVLRSFARKPFRGSSMSNTLTGEQSRNVISGTNASNRSPVNLLRVRPLSSVEIDQSPFRQLNESIKEFLEKIEINDLKSFEENSNSWKLGQKFLYARNFNIQLAVELYKNHQQFRRAENLLRIPVNDPTVIREIQTNKFFHLQPQAFQAAWIVYVVPSLNSSATGDSSDRARTIFQGFVSQLDFVTESVEVQKHGLNIIYDMKLINQQSTSDVNLSKKILKFLQTSYPVTLKMIFLLSSGKIFRSSEKIKISTSAEMSNYLSNEHGYSLDLLPESLLGKKSFSLFNDLNAMKNFRERLTNPKSSCSFFYSNENFNSSFIAVAPLQRNSKHDFSAGAGKFLISQEILPTIAVEPSLDTRNVDPKRMAVKSPYKPMNETEFLSKSENEIRREFRKLPDPPAKDPFAAKEEDNAERCRYRDVIPGEPTRVKLQPDNDDQHDFINANYVTGYDNQEKFYIFTQGPLGSTVRDFWRMIWQENISVIVMTTNLRESGMNKCFQYWPSENDVSMINGSYEIKFVKSERFDSFLLTNLTLTKLDLNESRTVYHAHYLRWPDHGVPSTTKEALLFLEKVNECRNLSESKAPLLLHCSAGIGRTGTFCAIDIGIKRFLDTKLIDVPSTVIKMRNERSGSVQTEDQYVFVYAALADFIRQNHQHLNSKSTTEAETNPDSTLITVVETKKKSRR